MFGLKTPITVTDDLALILCAALCVLDVLHVISDGDHELISDQLLCKQVH